MKSMFNKAKSALNKDDGHHSFPAQHQQNQQPMTDQPSSIQAPTSQDVLRYRYQHGTNLGSIFVLEKWLTSHMYPENAQSAELAAVEGNVKIKGMDATRAQFEKHWNEYVSDQDLDWLTNDAHCNSVRLPIGYFTLGPAYCNNTPFASVSGVYENAWAAVKRLISRCNSRGIGVLVDLHALPGGANGGNHSGTNSGKAQLWGNKSNLDLATRCLLFMSKELRNCQGVVGIQLINEAEYNARGMYEWYDSVVSQMGGIDNTMPLYISDAWNLGQAVKWINSRNSLQTGRSNPIIIDTHMYWCFSDADKKKSPRDIIEEARSKLSPLDGNEGSVVDHGAAQVIIGEYSCVLAEDSWGKGGGESKGDLVRAFGQAQSQRYQQRSGGSYFWTYRMNWMDGGEWGFKQQTKTGAITAPPYLSLSNQDVTGRIDHASSQEQQKQQSTFAAHCHYWDTNHPGQYEHHRFEDGWKVGFQDARAFFGFRAQNGSPGGGGDKIGMLDLWVKKRIVESGQAGKCLWEFEQGLRQGVRDFYELAGI